jgi:hypothetical protein
MTVAAVPAYQVRHKHDISYYLRFQIASRTYWLSRFLLLPQF